MYLHINLSSYFRIYAVSDFIMLEEKIKNIAVKNGASSAGITDVLKPDDLIKVESLIEDAPPDLSYLKSNIEKRLDIKKWYPDAKSVLLCAWQYWNSSMDYDFAISKIDDYPLFFKNYSRKQPSQELLKFNKDNKIPVKISRYALTPPPLLSISSKTEKNPFYGFASPMERRNKRGGGVSRDYHAVIKKKLKIMLKEIKTLDHNIDGRFFVDTSPVFEKKLSEFAGLGWQGKNSLIINAERGSYFFIGGIALSVALKSDKPLANLCGDCDLCIKACPTRALEKPGVLDANKCVSYWTTQSKSEIPLAIKEKLNGNIYGCDICQEVCPFNKDVKTDICEDFKIDD